MLPPVKEPLAGLALLVIFGFLIWYNRPNESSHPFDPYPPHQAPRITGDVYEAWLWKDPFGVSSAAIDAVIPPNQKPLEKKHDKKSGSPVQDYKICQDQIQDRLKKILDLDKALKEGEKKSPVILAPLVKVTPDTVENKELRTRQRYAVVAGLIESGYRPQEPDRLHFCSIQENSREYDVRWEHYRHESKDNSKDSSKGNLEDKPDIIVSWIDSEILTAEDKFPPGHDCTPSCNFPFKNLVKELSKDNEFYLFDVNGIFDRNRSESIKSHIECINEKNERKKRECGRHIELIKPAGMEGETGNQDLANKLGAELRLRGIKQPQEEVIIVTEYGSGNADMLASNIGKYFSRQECIKQGCTEPQCSKPESEREECRDKEPGEQTSGNGSGAVKAGEIRNIFYLKSSDGNPKKTAAQGKKDKNEDQSDDKPDHVSIIDLRRPPPLAIGPGQMDYFHRLAEEIRNVHNTVDFKKRDSGAKAVVILGSDFKDKLLIIGALREKMPHLLILTTDLDAQMLYPKHWRSTRNLVVASHFDLLLQEKEKTKNDKKREAESKNRNEDNKTYFWQRAYQDRFPLFRDSQQTNIFYRTLAIAEGNTSSIDDSEKTFPRIFEVGRNGFVRLSDTQKNAAEKNSSVDNHHFGRMLSALTFQDNVEKNYNLDYHPSDSTQENTAKRLSLLFWIAAFLIWFHFAIRPWSGTLSLYLLLFPLVIFASAFWFGMSQSGEPLSFTEGVSLGPTIFIQIIAVLLAVALFIRAICELDKNFRVLSREYSSILNVTVCPVDHEPDECGPWLKKRLRSLVPWLRGMNVWGWIKGWATFFVLIGTIAIYAGNDVYPSSQFFSFKLCFGLLVGFAIIYILFAWKDISIKSWREEDNHPERKTGHNENSLQACCLLRRLCRFFRQSNRSANYENILWNEYQVRGQVGYRLARVVAMWLIFAIIETLLVYLLPPWPLPCRGSTCGWASWTGVLSFTLIMLLLFFVLDAVRLNFYWIKKLRKQHPLLREKIIQGDIDAYNRTAGPRSAESLEKIVSLVATRTQAVDRLIYYPMFCIMLLLFAKIAYFDNQDLPLSKALTFGVAISILFFSGFMLRHEANQLRLCVKKRVQDLGKKYAKEKTTQQIVKRIDAIDEGAFQPMLEQPVMQALLLILTSLGLFASEYIKLFG